jgi:hypothetical protein
MASTALKHQEHLEPNPLKRERFCPVVIRPAQQTMTVNDVRKKVIEAKTKTEVIQALLEYLSQHGINSDASPDWWEKRKKLGV